MADIKQKEADAFKRGYKYCLQSILKDCNIHLNRRANAAKDKWQLSPLLLHSLTYMASGKGISMVKNWREYWGNICFSGEKESATFRITPRWSLINGFVTMLVLGSIAGSGTALLMDGEGNIWIFNPPNAIDRVVDFGCTAAIIIASSESSREGKKNWIEKQIARCWSYVVGGGGGRKWVVMILLLY